jgi:hypothetical protein
MDWELKPGDTISRVELHQRYGGIRQGGVSPSRSSPNVLIFSDTKVGERYGYFDGWRADGLFDYTGRGRTGDQQMTEGNLAILRHREDGRSIRLFFGVRGVVTYKGEFEIDPDSLFYQTDAPEFGTDRVRQVIVFRLRPMDTKPPAVESKLDKLSSSSVSEVAVEALNTESTFVNPKAETYEMFRREQSLVLAYKAYIQTKGSEVVRYQIRPEGEAKPLFSDLYDKSRNNLIEAKGTVAREAIRMAIGQLADYGRFVEPKPRLGVLLPTRPRKDLETLLLSQGIRAIWQTERGKFSDNADGLFT